MMMSVRMKTNRILAQMYREHTWFYYTAAQKSSTHVVPLCFSSTWHGMSMSKFIYLRRNHELLLGDVVRVWLQMLVSLRLTVEFVPWLCVVLSVVVLSVAVIVVGSANAYQWKRYNFTFISNLIQLIIWLTTTSCGSQTLLVCVLSPKSLMTVCTRAGTGSTSWCNTL